MPGWQWVLVMARTTLDSESALVMVYLYLGKWLGLTDGEAEVGPCDGTCVSGETVGSRDGEDETGLALGSFDGIDVAGELVGVYVGSRDGAEVRGDIVGP